MKHDNIVRLIEIVVSKGSVYMVFEYMDHDLTGLLQNSEVQFDTSQIKCYMKQVLEGLHFLHSKSILHRDIKGKQKIIGELNIPFILDDFYRLQFAL